MDVIRTPYTEPFTLRERLGIRWSIKRYDVERFMRTGFWQSIAHKLPRRLVLFAFIRVVAETTAKTNKSPNEITYSEAYEAWEGGPRRGIGTTLDLRARIEDTLAVVQATAWTVHGMDAAGAVHLAKNGHYEWTVFPDRAYRHPNDVPISADDLPGVVQMVQRILNEPI